MSCANSRPASPSATVRTGVPVRRDGRDREMHVAESVYPLGLLVLLALLLPLVAAGWLGWKLLRRVVGRHG